MGKLIVPVTSFFVLDESNVAANLTGTLTETALATTTLPVLLANDILRIETLWSTPGGNANNKILRIRLDGITGTQYLSQTSTTQLTFWEIRTIANRNSVSSQVGRSSGAGMGVSSGATVTSAIDTSVAKTLVFSGQLANTGDTITLERYLVELIRR